MKQSRHQDQGMEQHPKIKLIEIINEYDIQQDRQEYYYRQQPRPVNYEQQWPDDLRCRYNAGKAVRMSEVTPRKTLTWETAERLI